MNSYEELCGIRTLDLVTQRFSGFLRYCESFPCKTHRKACQNTRFLWPVLSLIRTELYILPLNRKTRVWENLLLTFFVYIVTPSDIVFEKPYMTTIFSASKSSKTKSNNNFHFSHFLSWGLTTIHRKHGKFQSSIFLRYLESVELFRSELLYGSIYTLGNLYNKKLFFAKLRIGDMRLNKGLKRGQNVRNCTFLLIYFNLIVYLF